MSDIASPPAETLDPPPLPPSPSAAADSPFLPPAVRPTTEPSPEPVFDAKAMVESQKHITTNPSYGDMPTGTPEGREAARQLRIDANRKRRRNRRIGWFVGLLFLAGILTAGWFAYQAFRDEQGESEPVERDDETGGALTPLGEQVETLEVMDDLNSTARPGGGLLDAIDDARDAVGQVNDGGDPSEPDAGGTDATDTDAADPDASEPNASEPNADEPAPVDAAEPDADDTDPPPTSLSFVQLLPPSVLAHADVLEPVEGFERYHIRGPDLAAADPAAWQTLVSTLERYPELPADDRRRTVLPIVLADDFAIAVRRDGDQVIEVIGLLHDPEVRVVGN